MFVAQASNEEVKRRLFNILTALSLVLCLGSVALWIRSYRCVDSVRYTRNAAANYPDARVFALSSSSGGFEFETMRTGTDFDPTLEPTAVKSAPLIHEAYPGDSTWYDGHRFLFGLFAYAPSENGAWSVVFPIALSTAAFAVLPGGFGVRLVRRKQRLRSFRCAQCGYDLRATPDRCPECGAIISAAGPNGPRDSNAAQSGDR